MPEAYVQHLSDTPDSMCLEIRHLEDKLARVEQERDALRIRARQFYAALLAVTPVLIGDAEWHDKGWCPQDDTCDCTIPTNLRVALGRDGWSKP